MCHGEKGMVASGSGVVGIFDDCLSTSQWSTKQTVSPAINLKLAPNTPASMQRGCWRAGSTGWELSVL